MNQIKLSKNKAIKAAIRDNMIAMGYFNKAKVQIHKGKKIYDRKQFKKLDDL
jgi:hypothetical protein